VTLSEEYLTLKKLEEKSPILEVEIMKPKIPLMMSSGQLLCDKRDFGIKDSIGSNNHTKESKQSKKRERSTSITQEEWNSKNTIHFEPFDF
jgi:hypothetical protein